MNHSMKIFLLTVIAIAFLSHGAMAIEKSLSCVDRCGSFDAGALCQCDQACVQYGDCCNDYENACTAENYTQYICSKYFSDFICDDSLSDCGSSYKTGTSMDACDECQSGGYQCSSQIKTNCGNGIKEIGEQCDGNDIGSQSCNTKGFSSGTLKCTAGCKIDTGSCIDVIDKYSCKGQCGNYESSKPCQCDEACQKYNDCCPDYEATCKIPVTNDCSTLGTCDTSVKTCSSVCNGITYYCFKSNIDGWKWRTLQESNVFCDSDSDICKNTYEYSASCSTGKGHCTKGSYVMYKTTGEYGWAQELSNNDPACFSNSTCPSSKRSVNPAFGSSGSYDVNADLGDYGVFFDDSSVHECSYAAALRMKEKIDNTLSKRSDAYQTWLEGVNVGLIFSSALQMGGQGTITKEMDESLKKVMDKYSKYHYISSACGLSGSKFGDNCMDDYAIEAFAYSWIAAYEYYSGRPYDSYETKAKAALDNSLSPSVSVCLYNPIQPGTCVVPSSVYDGAQMLKSGIVEVASFNHNQQNIAYGIGMMSSVSSASVALSLIGKPFMPTEDQKTVAMGIMEEAQKKSDPSGYHFKKNCYDINGQPITDCGDVSYQYKPRMFPVKNYYVNTIGAPKATVADPYDVEQPQNAYQYDSFDESTFSNNNYFYSAGRRAIYKKLGSDWWTSKPPLAGFKTA